MYGTIQQFQLNYQHFITFKYETSKLRINGINTLIRALQEHKKIKPWF